MIAAHNAQTIAEKNNILTIAGFDQRQIRDLMEGQYVGFLDDLMVPRDEKVYHLAVHSTDYWIVRLKNSNSIS